MSGECPAARMLAERMACEYLAASGIELEPGDPAAEGLVRMLLPAAEAVAEVQGRAELLQMRLDAYAGALAELLLRDAEVRGGLDDVIWPDVVLADDFVCGLEWDALLDGTNAGAGARREEAPGHG